MFTVKAVSGQKATNYLAISFVVLGMLAPVIALSDVLKGAALTLEKTSVGGVGRLLKEPEIAALDSHIFTDGAQLPDGQGDVKMGSGIYQQQCASCHGGLGEGASAVELVGDRALLTTEFPDKGIGVYWPYAPTLYQYIERAMPPDKPGLFTTNELYSLIAYLLYLNKLLPESGALDRDSLANIKLPNRFGFADQFAITNVHRK